MDRTLRFAHTCGLVMFLGSVAAFAVASGVPRAGDLAALATVRQVIGQGTGYLTLPGLALVIVCGIAMIVAKPDRLGLSRTRVMAVIAAVLVVNTAFVILPAASAATAMARASARAGSLDAGYQRAYLTESVAGGGNIVLALTALAAGLARPEVVRETEGA